MPLPSITITGTVVAEAELRFTGTGKAVVKLRIAANERKRTEAGGWVDGDSCFLDVSAWENDAEAIAEQVQKGDRVVVTGKLKQRSWEKDGQTRYAYEVQAYDVAIVVRPPKAEREKPTSPPSNSPWDNPAPTQGVDPWATPGESKAPF